MYDYKGYTGVWQYDASLERFTGEVIDLRDQIHFEGESVSELKASMRRAVDHYLEVCAERGEGPDRPFSGRFNVRLDPAMHREVAKAAALKRESMNDWVRDALERKAREELGRS